MNHQHLYHPKSVVLSVPCYSLLSFSIKKHFKKMPQSSRDSLTCNICPMFTKALGVNGKVGPKQVNPAIHHWRIPSSGSSCRLLQLPLLYRSRPSDPQSFNSIQHTSTQQHWNPPTAGGGKYLQFLLIVERRTKWRPSNSWKQSHMHTEN